MKKALIGMSLALACSGVAATEFPTQTMTLIVPYTAGGSSDSLARAVGAAVAKEADKTLIVENRPGGSTVIGAQYLLNKPADGHTVLLMAASFVVNPNTIKDLPYDTQKDFKPVTQLAANPHVLVVRNDLPVSNLQEFIEWAKQPSSQGSYSSFGLASSGHLGFELFNKQAGTELLHVPYKGAAPATLAVLTGEVDATLGDIGVVAPHVQAGKVKAIAVTGDTRMDMLPDVPTFAEAGLPDLNSASWFGLVVPAATPDEHVAALNKLYKQALSADTVQNVMRQQGMHAVASTPEEFAQFMQAESDKYKQIIDDAGIVLQ
ncbi:Bug family tripartite tricarboxylate transporter substrate binding protein [Alcaligenes endophyticus]|uniref:Tripartite tricarboxylate transporter substrate binding protein n=1 Tax=Alcaligenes endophyticus TaxID=1929088 RepID=A0ABT8ELX1_9BURK|nr:tripartite tricarboxylate transporter substrate binding protein [Alcaligenes endophyticus]MCX5591139.1 tripartite tricarboxylate transporter substrate binding protein [Alcaligenes endophyticus]MDN4122283.1 tripartite tricarboxylate transporter substrate binding protein [Alcaligenes endophyticus]